MMGIICSASFTISLAFLRSFPRTNSGRTNNGRPIAVLTLSSSLKRTGHQPRRRETWD